MGPTCHWYVYILSCADGTYYIGVAQDVQRRVQVHNVGWGSKHAARRRPVRLVYSERCDSKSAARTRENDIKGWRREKKEELIRS